MNISPLAGHPPHASMLLDLQRGKYRIKFRNRADFKLTIEIQ